MAPLSGKAGGATRLAQTITKRPWRSRSVVVRAFLNSPRRVRWRNRDQAGLKSILSPLDINKDRRPWSQRRRFCTMFGDCDECTVIPENSFLTAVHLNLETPIPSIYVCNPPMACRFFSRAYRGPCRRQDRAPVPIATLSHIDTGNGSRCGEEEGQCYKPSHGNCCEASATPVPPSSRHLCTFRDIGLPRWTRGISSGRGRFALGALLPQSMRLNSPG
jgi:hypothetical protein